MPSVTILWWSTTWGTWYYSRYWRRIDLLQVNALYWDVRTEGRSLEAWSWFPSSANKLFTEGMFSYPDLCFLLSETFFISGIRDKEKKKSEASAFYFLFLTSRSQSWALLLYRHLKMTSVFWNVSTSSPSLECDQCCFVSLAFSSGKISSLHSIKVLFNTSAFSCWRMKSVQNGMASARYHFFFSY